VGALSLCEAVPSDRVVHAACAHAHCVLGARYPGAATLAGGGRGEAAGGSGGSGHRGRRRGGKNRIFLVFFFAAAHRRGRSRAISSGRMAGALRGGVLRTDGCGVGVRTQELASDGDAGFGRY
jgi:hypothetical protein